MFRSPMRSSSGSLFYFRVEVTEFKIDWKFQGSILVMRQHTSGLVLLIAWSCELECSPTHNSTQYAMQTWQPIQHTSPRSTQCRHANQSNSQLHAVRNADMPINPTHNSTQYTMQTWQPVQLTTPRNKQYQTRRMLPHNHNGSLTFSVNFKRRNLNKEIKNSLRMIS
jgi:hypothetical protein